MRELCAVTLMSLLVVALASDPSALAMSKKARGKVHLVGATGSWPMRYEWAPASLEVATGDKVVWDVAAGLHNVTPYTSLLSTPWGDGEALPTDKPGRVSYRFKEPGTFLYYCSNLLHSVFSAPACVGQCGTVVVK